MTARELLRAVALGQEAGAAVLRRHGASIPDAERSEAIALQLRQLADRIDAEMAALEVRAKDRRDPLTDHAFCALNALARLDAPLEGKPR